VSYPIATSNPRNTGLDSLQGLETFRSPGASGAPPQILASLASIRRGVVRDWVSHDDIQPVVDIYGSVQGRDLGGVARDLNKIVADSKAPQGSASRGSGQIRLCVRPTSGCSEAWSFFNLLVYLCRGELQSWARSVHYHLSAAAALAGIAWFSSSPNTTLSVARAHRFNYVYGCRHGEQHPGRELWRKSRWKRGRLRSRPHRKPALTRFRPVLHDGILAMMIGMVRWLWASERW